MQLPRWIMPGQGSRLLKRGPVAGELRTEVRNLTRRTLLAHRVEVANTSAKRSKGLLGRDGLAHGEGLWIVPCESVHTIGMRFAIDLVYLDRKHRIRKLCANVPPWRISACLTAHSILELPAGTILQSQSERGDKLEFSKVAADLNLDLPSAAR